TIPTDAVQYGANGAYVYLVDEAHKAYIRPVKLGISDEGRIAVLDGLKAGDDVVLEGLDRLREGREVRIADESGGTVGTPTAPPAGQQRPGSRR
ncbi:efflux RND transporter periplasmic adaptor subunit, partial [Kerstersia sp.]|uniref:efflux RND transporter periplasmic adaptor subunit n=1 Tax=Kerstersia sp. TaxID=1930783 RepID=UPI003F8EC7E3